ncbi:hypothetical protein HYX18_04275 [Candidatus Woesearchaeota archaeon]|nr:hypothetical protein [Candidatus Woesearchaeota archaeon]
MKKTITSYKSLAKICALIIAAYLLLVLLVMINFFAMSIQAISYTKGISKSPIYLSPTLLSLTIAGIILLIGAWILFWHLFKGSTKGIGYVFIVKK